MSNDWRRHIPGLPAPKPAKHSFEAKGVFAWAALVLVLWVPTSIVLLIVR